jgi:hypothetical protein
MNQTYPLKENISKSVKSFSHYWGRFSHWVVYRFEVFSMTELFVCFDANIQLNRKIYSNSLFVQPPEVLIFRDILKWKLCCIVQANGLQRKKGKEVENQNVNKARLSFITNKFDIFKSYYLWIRLADLSKSHVRCFASWSRDSDGIR